MTQRIRDCRPVAKLIDEFYRLPGNEAGGLLHVVLDDYNLGTEFVELSYADATEQGDWHAAALAHVLLMCSTTQRRKALRMAREIARERRRA